MNIAVVVVAYNRKKSLERLLYSLSDAYYDGDKISLIISIDKSNTDEVEKFADCYEWVHGDKIVDKHLNNLGLRAHMMSLGKWFNNYDALIILEDDIFVAPSYYLFAKKAVEKYYSCSSIAGISLYSYSVNYQTGIPFIPMKDPNDVYFMSCATSWGQVWLKDSWNDFYKWYVDNIDFPYSKEIPNTICLWGDKSWLKYHIRYCIENDKYFVFPYCSLSTNFSEEGEHNNGNISTAFQVPLQSGKKLSYTLPVFGSEAIYYDGFFENISLYGHLGLSKSCLCLDLNGMSGNKTNKKYWLTTKIYDYKIINSFGLAYRPIDLNIITGTKGHTIFLYDTEVIEKNPFSYNTGVLLYPYFLYNITYFIKSIGMYNIFKDIFVCLKYELVKRLKKFK